MTAPLVDTTQPEDLRRQFESEGFIGPLPAISRDEAAIIAERLKRELLAEAMAPAVRRNRHFDLPEVARAATAPALLAAIEAIYSPSIVLWRSHVFSGKPGRGLAWHSDFFRTLLRDPLDHLTVHLALTEATEDNCVMLVPGSHRWSEAERRERGFELIEKTKDTGYGTPYYVRQPGDLPVRRMVLAPGEFFCFHPATLHASVDRVRDPSNSNSLVASLKQWGRKLENRLVAMGLREPPSRLAIGLRYCDPRNPVSPAAFRESFDAGSGPVCVAGPTVPPEYLDWRRAESNREAAHDSAS